MQNRSDHSPFYRWLVARPIRCLRDESSTLTIFTLHAETQSCHLIFVQLLDHSFEQRIFDEEGHWLHEKASTFQKKLFNIVIMNFGQIEKT